MLSICYLVATLEVKTEFNRESTNKRKCVKLILEISIVVTNTITVKVHKLI